MTRREHSYHQTGKVIGRFKKRLQKEEEDAVCDICKGGGDSSGPYYCWRCKGTHIVKPQKRIER